jgi:hypothetical protein
MSRTASSLAAHHRASTNTASAARSRGGSSALKGTAEAAEAGSRGTAMGRKGDGRTSKEHHEISGESGSGQAISVREEQQPGRATSRKSKRRCLPMCDAHCAALRIYVRVSKAPAPLSLTPTNKRITVNCLMPLSASRKGISLLSDICLVHTHPPMKGVRGYVRPNEFSLKNIAKKFNPLHNLLAQIRSLC